ncbi:MAG: Thiamine pyrophosphate-requiring enzymes, partial [uncultured Gemmatimonadaceae bacterium]
EHGDREDHPARRPPHREAAQGPRRHEAVHAVGRAPLLDLRRLPRGGHRHRRRPPRADGRLRRGGLGEGHPRARRRRVHRRPRRHERDERARLGAAEQLPGRRLRRPRPGDALGPGLAAGDRPRAVRAPAGQAGRHRAVDRRDPRARRRGVRRGDDPAHGAGVPRLPARPRVHGGRRGPGRRPRPRPHPGGRRRRARPRGGAAARGGAPGDHGRHEPLLGPRRAGAARARRGAAHPRVPQRPGARLRARRPRALLLAGALDGPQGGRRRAGGRRPDGLPPRLRRLVRGGDGDRRDRRHRARPRAPAPRRRRALRPRHLDLARPARGDGRRRAGLGRVARLAARDGGREARGGGGAAQRRPLAAAPAAPLQGARRGPRPRRDHRLRRRRLRLLRGPRHRLLRAGLLARSGPVRVPGLRAGLRAGRQARAPRPPGRAAARRRCLRLLGHGVRHPLAPRRQCGGRHGQQRHLGPREAPHGVPL